MCVCSVACTAQRLRATDVLQAKAIKTWLPARSHKGAFNVVKHERENSDYVQLVHSIYTHHRSKPIQTHYPNSEFSCAMHNMGKNIGTELVWTRPFTYLNVSAYQDTFPTHHVMFPTLWTQLGKNLFERMNGHRFPQ